MGLGNYCVVCREPRRIMARRLPASGVQGRTAPPAQGTSIGEDPVLNRAVHKHLRHLPEPYVLVPPPRRAVPKRISHPRTTTTPSPLSGLWGKRLRSGKPKVPDVEICREPNVSKKKSKSPVRPKATGEGSQAGTTARQIFLQRPTPAERLKSLEEQPNMACPSESWRRMALPEGRGQSMASPRGRGQRMASPRGRGQSTASPRGRLRERSQWGGVGHGMRIV